VIKANKNQDEMCYGLFKKQRPERIRSLHKALLASAAVRVRNKFFIEPYSKFKSSSWQQSYGFKYTEGIIRLSLYPYF
jgi:hypothetical protein